jgi:hypothetical protein
MSNTILTKKYYDLAGELYEITSRLVVKAEADYSLTPTVVRSKAYVQWSKNNLEPLEDAIENLVQRVRDDTKARKREVFTRAEQAQLNATYDELKRQERERHDELS